MKLYKVRGGTEKDLYDKSYTIGVGISLGSKWFSLDNILELIDWSLKYTKDFVMVYVADSIHAINIEVRKRKSSEKAKEIALKLGSEILSKVKKLVDERFSQDDLARIHYAKWNELLTPEFQDKVKFLHDKYSNDATFKNTILELVDKFTKNEKRFFSQEDKIKIGRYFIEELPEVLNRCPIRGLMFDAYVFPFDGILFDFIDNIQKGITFPEIKEKIINSGIKVFLEVRE